MKRILGIILAVLVGIAFFGLLVLACMDKGLDFNDAILEVLKIAFAFMGASALAIWLSFDK